VPREEMVTALQLRDHHVTLLRDLAMSAGLGPESATALQRRAQLRPEARQGAPHALLLGDPDAIRLLMTSLVGAELAKKIHESTAPVVVVGRRPDIVRPMVAAWPNLKTEQLEIDGLMVLKARDHIAEGTVEALASLGTVELGILVTRLAQTINQSERQLVRTLPGVVETIRVAIVGYPAEEVSVDEAGLLANRARLQMSEVGFGPERFDGAFFWLGGAPPRGLPGEAASPGELITIDAKNAGRNRNAALATWLDRLLDTIAQRLAGREEPIGLPATEEDLNRLASQFDGHLEGLGKTLRQHIADMEIRTAEQARAFVVDTIQGWITGTGQGLQSATLTLADRFRPGTKSLLAATAQAAAPDLIVDPPPPERATASLQTAEGRALFAFLRRFHWARVALAAAIGGLAVYFAMIFLPLLIIFLPQFSAEPWMSRLGAIAIGVLLGLAVYFISGEPWIIGHGQRPAERGPAEPSSRLRGWSVFSARLSAAYGTHLHNEGIGAAKRNIAMLREQLVNGALGR
jgi:hypothetical protein